MTAPHAAFSFGDERCPCCSTTLLTPYTTVSFMGQDICFVCADGMDREDARRNVQQMTRRITVTMREEP